MYIPGYGSATKSLSEPDTKKSSNGGYTGPDYPWNPGGVASGSASSASGSTQTSTAKLDPVNNPDDAETLVQRHLPILVIPAGKNDNLPADPLAFIAVAELRQDVFLKDKSIANNRDSDPTNDFGPEAIANPEQNNLFLDINTDQRYSLGLEPGANGAPVHYETDFDGNPPTITYHFFYAYNDGPSVQNHEGDWEKVTVELNPDDYEAKNVYFSAHGDATSASYADVADDVTGRPVVWVASGTHANHATGGTHDANLGFNEHAVSEQGGVPIRELEGAVIYEDWGDVRKVEDQAWYTDEPGNDGVRWGEIGDMPGGHTSGPHGPSAEKGAIEFEIPDPNAPVPVPNPGPVPSPPTGTTVPPPTTEVPPPSLPELVPAPPPPMPGPTPGTTTTTVHSQPYPMPSRTPEPNSD